MAQRRVVVIGAGPIGAAVAAEVRTRPSQALVGVVDNAPDKAGVDVAGVSVVGGLDAVADADVAVVCTSSSFSAIAPLVRACLARGLHVVTTCEEAVWPRLRHGALAQAIDVDARAAGRAVVGTGVNPGFLMDALPAFVTAIAARVDDVTVTRAQDARPRRKPFQDKIGVGLTPEAFAAKVSAGGFLHRGLEESCALLASALGGVDVDAAAFVVDHAAVVDDATGLVRGVRQRCVWAGPPRVELRFEAWLDHDDPRDEIVVRGVPDLRVRADGVHGDVATRAIAVNAIDVVGAAQPGLRTMLDLPLAVRRR
jgi:hypothetical protein